MTIDSWPTSATAWERSKNSLGGGVSSGMRASMQPHPLSFHSGTGPRLTDIDGNVYLDYVLGWGPSILGHSHPHLVEAVSAQLQRAVTFGACHPLEYEVAERVLATIPGTERVLWTNTGTEATQIALRLARAATKRQRFAKFGGHYHGWSDAFLVGYRPDAHGLLGPGSLGQAANAASMVDVLPWGDLAAAAVTLREPDNDIAALFVEPVLCNSGVLMPPDGFLEGLRELCSDTGTILVFDEVITGFRIAAGGGTERFGINPDLVVLAKAIGGGFPLAAVAGRAWIIDQSTAGVVHSGSYNGNPIVLSAAKATLEVLSAPGVYGQFERQGAALAGGFEASMQRHGLPGATTHVGPVVQCSFGPTSLDSFDDFMRSDQKFYDELSVELLRRGVFCLPGGRWYISTAHTDGDIAATLAAFDDSIAAAMADGRTPPLSELAQ